MNFINRIGQRNFAKILFGASLVLGLGSFILKNGPSSFATWHLWLGVVLLSAPNGLLALCAIKSREYRFVSIVLSMMVLSVNFILFYINVGSFLFLVTLFELLVMIAFYVIVSKSAHTKKIYTKNIKEKQKVSVNEA